MKLFVTAKPRSKIEAVKKIDETHFVVAVKKPPVKGQANTALIKALAAYLNKAPSQLKIVHGAASKQKVIEVE